MTTISLKRESILAIKNFLDNKAEEVSAFSFIGKKGENTVGLFIKNSDSQEYQNSGFAKIEGRFLIEVEEAVGEDFKFLVNDDPENALRFLLNSSIVSENPKIRVAPSTGKALFFYDGGVEFSVKADYSNSYIVSLTTENVLSFTKEQFRKAFCAVNDLSVSTEWIDKKIAGVYAVVSDSGAYLMVGTKTAHVHRNILNENFNREYAGGFVHDKGIILIKDFVINQILDSAKEDETIGFVITTPVTSDDQRVYFNIRIGGRYEIVYGCFGRKKIDTICTTNVIGFISGTDKSSCEIPTDKVLRFVKAFKDNPMFMNDVVSLDFSSKGRLTIKPIDSSVETFKCVIDKCKVSKDTSFELNFYVLENIISKMTEETTKFIEKTANNSRVYITDGKTDFIVGKTIRKE